MTEQFERWVREIVRSDSDLVMPNTLSLHFWLTAFVREVKQEQEKWKASGLPWHKYQDCLSNAFEYAARKFGLEDK